MGYMKTINISEQLKLWLNLFYAVFQVLKQGKGNDIEISRGKCMEGFSWIEMTCAATDLTKWKKYKKTKNLKFTADNYSASYSVLITTENIISWSFDVLIDGNIASDVSIKLITQELKERLS